MMKQTSIIYQSPNFKCKKIEEIIFDPKEVGDQSQKSPANYTSSVL